MHNQRTYDLIDQVVALRKERRLTQQYIASASGLPQSTIARIETKKVVPTITTFEKIALAVGVSLSLQPLDLDDTNLNLSPADIT